MLTGLLLLGQGLNPASIVSENVLRIKLCDSLNLSVHLVIAEVLVVPKVQLDLLKSVHIVVKVMSDLDDSTEASLAKVSKILKLPFIPSCF
jgi:hypothetical protein